MHRGYIKLWRKIQDWGWYSCPNTKSLFIHLMLEANHKDFMFLGQEIKRGSVVVGRHKLAQILGMSEMQVRVSMQHLLDTKDITIKTTNRFSIVSIANYGFYQDEVTSKVTNKQPTDNQQITTIKECKNEKNIKEPKKQAPVNPFFWDFKKLYPNCLAFKRTQGAFQRLNVDEALWGVMRKAIIEQKESKSWKQGFIPASYKWLEEERWKDSFVRKVESPF